MKIHQSETAIDHFHSPDAKRTFGAQELLVLYALRVAGRPLTLSEIRQEILRQGGPEIPESTISGRLHDLAGTGRVTDDSEKRECTVTGRRKKTWRYVRALDGGEGEQGDLFSRN